MAKLCAIYAVTQDYVIGVDGHLPWGRAQRDMQIFKEKTMNGVVIMGRKTWESLPPASRPLPNRVNIVLSTDPDYPASGAIVMTSPEQVLTYVRTSALKCWVIGGAEIYSLFKGHYDEIHQTEVGMTVSGGYYYTECPDFFNGYAWTTRVSECDSYVENGIKFQNKTFYKGVQTSR